jgi:hypothetical protein
MLLMLANNTGIRVGHLAGKFPGSIGHLYSPGSQRGPFEFCPYALDNGVFAKGDKWKASDWLKMLEWAKLSGQSPLWNLVPDTVADRDATLKKWAEFSPLARKYGWPLAFAAQDGMRPSDVPGDAEVVFVGGSTEWKWSTFRSWCDAFPRVHIGRVNSYHRLLDCERAGAKSIDGTGWTRGDQRQWRGLVSYLEEVHGIRPRQDQDLLITLEQDGIRVS